MEELADSGLKIVTTKRSIDTRNSEILSELKDILLPDLIHSLKKEKFPRFYETLKKLNGSLIPAQIDEVETVETIIGGLSFSSGDC